VVLTLAKLDAYGIPVRQPAPEDVVIAIWLLPFEIPRRNTNQIFNHPESLAHIPNDANRGYCSTSALAVHYVKEEHFVHVRGWDGVLMCRQEHELSVQMTMLSEREDPWFTISSGDVVAIIVDLYLTEQQLQTTWWQRDFSNRPIYARLVYTRAEDGRQVEIEQVQPFQYTCIYMHTYI
jgi:hypothetical protein